MPAADSRVPAFSAACAARIVSSTSCGVFLPRTSFSTAGLRPLERLQVGEHQLGADRLEVAGRVDPARDVHDVRVGEPAHHLRDRVRLADVREELVAEPLPLAGALDDAGDVDERDRRGHDLLGVEDLGERLQARVGQVDDADVRLDRRERVVRREHVVLGQRVEERRLADVGQADDADGECHGRQP